jgi:hypothetical protein
MIATVNSPTSITLFLSAGTQTNVPFLASGTAALNITGTTGEVAASATFTVGGTPTNFDRIQLVYLGNVVFDTGVAITTGMSLAAVASMMEGYVNAATSSTVPLTATSSGANFTVACTQPGQDGNTVELLTMYKTSPGNTTLVPAGTVSPVSGLTAKLAGGTDPTSFHVHLDFSAMGLTSLRQAWLTLAPPLPIDTGSVNPTLVAFTAGEFEYVFSNWTITDPSSNTPLKVAGPGSVLVGNADAWSTYTGSGWSQAPGFFYKGFAQVSPTANDEISIFYSCQYTHDLYAGSSLFTDRGIFNVKLDGVSQQQLDMYLNTSSPVVTRRQIASAVAAGTHTVTLTVNSTANASSSGTNCYFDYLQAAVASDVQDAPQVYSNVGLSFDFDTDQTYKLPPQRSLWIAQRAGFNGDVDFYAGVFFALKRVRNGGNFHLATVTISGTPAIGTGFGNGDAFFVDIGGTALGAAAYPADSLTTLAQRLVDAINSTFVGVCAAPTSSSGQFTVTSISPINGFTFSVYASAGAVASIASTGDVNAGNEGTWSVDSTQTSPLNRAFSDYLTDFCAQCVTDSMTATVAFSQELLAPPDVNTSAGAWAQRFANGNQVLTDTSFGSWGAGFVEAVASGVYQQTGHGYITGNSAHFASGIGSGEWYLVVVNANHYTLGARIADNGSGGYLYPGYTPGVGDSVFIDLQTSQCAFNPSTVTAYMEDVFKQAATIMNGAGLTAWLQFGEILHWFFSERMSMPIGFASFTAPISIGTPNPHGLVTGQSAIIAGVQGNTAANGTWPAIVVTDSTHFTLTGSSGNGSYVSATGTASGGGMAFYDLNQVAAASTALGRALASFYTQDDDPTVNGSADANFLAGRIYAHVSAVATAVLGVVSGAQFELLFPYDVCFDVCYYTDDLPYPQGGRLNRAVNLPSQWNAMSGSGLNRIKMEGLSWGATYRNLDNAKATVRFPYQVLSWAQADTRYLVPWFNGGCPWAAEYLFCVNEGTPALNMWAFDHLNLIDQPVPLPVNAATVTSR